MQEVTQLIDYYVQLHAKLADQLEQEGETIRTARGDTKGHPAAAIRKGVADIIIKLVSMRERYSKEDKEQADEIQQLMTIAK